MKCGAQGCTRDATEALRFVGMPGHVHNCSEDAAINREWCDVAASAPLIDKCPWPCTPGPIYEATPTALPDIDLEEIT